MRTSMQRHLAEHACIPVHRPGMARSACHAFSARCTRRLGVQRKLVQQSGNGAVATIVAVRDEQHAAPAVAAVAADDLPEVVIPGWPTPPGVVLRMHPTFGLSAFTSRDFKATEVVVDEVPVLSAVPQADPLLQQLHAAACAADPEGDPEDWVRACSIVVAFWRASPSQQHFVLTHAFSQAPASSSLWEHCHHRAQVLAQVAPCVLLRQDTAPSSSNSSSSKWQELLSASTLQTVLQASEMNAHAVPDGASLFPTHCRFAHTCSVPNTEFLFAGGRGYHVAVTDIPAGELLTTTYLGPTQQLMGRAARRQRLWTTFAFMCTCERCSSSRPDPLAALPCPCCAPPEQARQPDGLLPRPIALGQQRPSGLLRLHRGADSSSSSDETQSVGVWQCDSCGASILDDDTQLFPGHPFLSEADPAAHTSSHSTQQQGDSHDATSSSSSSGRVPLRLEQVLSMEVLALDWQQKGDPSSVEYEEVLGLLASVAWSLGAFHWLYHYMLLLQSRMLLSEMAGVAAVLRAQPGSAAAAAQGLEEACDKVASCLTELADNWTSTCDWMRQQAELDADEVLTPHAVALSVNLLRLAPALQPIWQKQPELLTRVQDLCSTLLASAEPQLRPYLEWPLPEPHPMAEDYQLARKLLSTMPALGQLLQRVPAGYSVGLGGAGELGGLLQKLRKVLPGA